MEQAIKELIIKTVREILVPLGDEIEEDADNCRNHDASVAIRTVAFRIQQIDWDWLLKQADPDTREEN